MSKRRALIIYHSVITFSFIWAGVEFIAGRPFDGLVLFTVTLSFKSYRDVVIGKK